MSLWTFGGLQVAQEILAVLRNRFEALGGRHQRKQVRLVVLPELQLHGRIINGVLAAQHVPNVASHFDFGGSAFRSQVFFVGGEVLVALCIRLFANMFAGDMVTLVFFSLVPIGVPVLFLGLHIGVSLLQTYIFVLLTTVYLAGAVAEEH